VRREEKNKMCIAVVYLGSISNSKDKLSEICLDLGGAEPVPARYIISEVVGQDKAAWIGKPKLFFLLDDLAQSDDIRSSRDKVIDRKLHD
jgi:hypothetical protein